MTVQPKIVEFFKDYPVRRLGKGQSVFQIGEEVNKVQYLVEGTVIEYDITPAGNTAVINAFSPGTFFPMSCVLNNQPTAYVFEAASPVTIKQAPKDQVIKFLEDNPDVTLDLLKRVYIGSDGILKRMAYLMGGSAADRVKYELVNASYRFGKTSPDGSIYIEMSENDIAQRSGLSRETVNRSLKPLKSDGIVKVTQGGIQIKDLSAIEDSLF